MKPLLFTTLSVIFFLPVYCQVNWFPTGAKWHYEYGSFLAGGLTTLEVLSEDTIIGSNPYKRVLSTTIYGFPGSMDTFTEMLYVFEENQVVYGFDRYYGGTLLYDFNAAIGDTLAMYFGGLSPYPFVVDSIGVIDINGSQLAFQDLRFKSYIEQEDWDKVRVVEGLGSINSHLFHSHTIIQPFDAPSYHFRCYNDQNIGLVNLSYNQVDCDYIEGVTSLVEPPYASIKIFPNPTDHSVTLQYDGQPIDNLIIIDILGSIRIREHSPTQAIRRIDLNELENGLYFIMGIDKIGKTLFVEKITKFGS